MSGASGSRSPERRPPQVERRRAALVSNRLRLEPRAFRKLLDAGQWENGLPPNLLVSSGQTPSRVWMVAEGRIEVRRNGNTLREVTAGDFVGEILFLAGKPMGADVLICDPVRCLSWSSQELEAFIGEQPEIGAVVQRLLGRCLVRKLHQQSPERSELALNDAEFISLAHPAERHLKARSEAFLNSRRHRKRRATYSPRRRSPDGRSFERSDRPRPQ